MAAHSRQSLEKLPAKIARLNFDITEFSDCIKLQRSALMSQGEESTDLLVNIFETLGSLSDPSFHIYMERIKDDYNNNDEKVTADYRMSWCKIKCKNLQEHGNYNVPSKEEERIIACIKSLHGFPQPIGSQGLDILAWAKNITRVFNQDGTMPKVYKYEFKCQVSENQTFHPKKRTIYHVTKNDEDIDLFKKVY